MAIAPIRAVAIIVALPGLFRSHSETWIEPPAQSLAWSWRTIEAWSKIEYELGKRRLEGVVSISLLLRDYVLFEKTVPAGHWFGHATGVALLIWGAGMLALAFRL